MEKKKQLVGEAWPAESPYQAAGACSWRGRRALCCNQLKLELALTRKA